MKVNVKGRIRLGLSGTADQEIRIGSVTDRALLVALETICSKAITGFKPVRKVGVGLKLSEDVDAPLVVCCGTVREFQQAFLPLKAEANRGGPRRLAYTKPDSELKATRVAARAFVWARAASA